MSSPGSLSAALAFVPDWWQETSDPAGLVSLLAGWSRACGWRSCGFAWPSEGPAGVVKSVQNATVSEALPAEAGDAARRIRVGEATAFYPIPGGSGRVFAAVTFPGRPAGLVWAEKPVGQPWSEPDRAYLTLTARAMERSPAVAAAIGPVIDPDRLFQRLGDAAVIAGRMAHDFDNILTGIIGFADLATPLIPAGSQQSVYVAEIGKVGHRGIQFTQQLHQLSRSSQVKPGPGSVAAAITKEEIRLRPATHPSLRVEKELPATLPAVALELGPLQTVLGHLMENAVEACPQGGVVRVSARQVELTGPDARAFFGKAVAGPQLLVSVSDTGPGIKPEIRRRLFAEPFFTTKVRHRGLGLAVAYRILCAHGGGIQLEPVTPPGIGTVARVVLPLAPVRPPAVTPPPQTALRGDAVPGPGLNKNATTVGG